MVRLKLSLLGAFNALLDGNPITTFESNKVRALLACLAAEPDRPQRREALAVLLWPDWPQQSAQANLRHSLSNLRKNLGERDARPPFLLISRDTLQLNRQSDIWVDTWAFQRLVLNQKSAIDNLQSAISLYTGPFMDGFSLPDSAAFEEWLAVRREGFLRQVVQVLGLLCEYHEERGEYDRALPYAYRQVELEPWREEAHQGVMRVLAKSGQRSAALAQFEKCRSSLVRGLGVEPGAATLALFERIRDGKLADPQPLPAAIQVNLSQAGQSSLPPSSPQDFSPPKREEGPRHNLPLQLTRFFGREDEIEQVKELLGEWRLVTLTGSGGVGKTRLSLQVAGSVLDRFADGVWYVELAALSDPVLVSQQVAASLGVREEPGRPILETLASYLRSRQVLLVLDNCEHLLEACSRLVDALLRAGPASKILVSSREPLGVAGEAIFRLPSLPFPDPIKLPDLESLDAFASVRLFVDRARLALPTFQMTGENAAAMARICQRLDGIPLAIELAAARTSVLTLEQLAARLDDAFRLLTGGSRSTLPRQQTLRAAIDWSHKLLDERERLLFQRLAVFAGGCTLEAAEAICSGDGLERGEVLDLLASLADKSMVIVDFQKDAEATRYRLLETIRQYASEKLLDSGESARLHTRHRDFFLAFAESNVPKVPTWEQLIWIRRLDAEYDNLRRAIEWSFGDRTDPEAGLRLVLAVEPFWGYRYFLEAVGWFKRGIALCQSHPGISPGLYAKILGRGSHRLAFSDPQTALSGNKLAVEISRQLGPDGQVLLIERLLDLVWETMWDLHDYRQALAPFAEAETLLQELGPEKYPELRAWMASHKAHLANQQGNHQDASTYARESIQISERSGYKSIWPVIFLGDAYLNLREYEQARSTYLEALHEADKLGDLRKTFVLHHLGIVDLFQGNLDRALEYAQAGLQEAFEVPDNNNMAICLSLAARVLAKQGLAVQAAQLSGAAHALHERQGRLSWEDSALDAILSGWEAGTDRDVIRQAYQAGVAMTVDDAVNFTLNLRL